MRSILHRTRNNQNGQGLVEYALLLLVVIGLFSVINGSILRGIGKIWRGAAAQIAAGCPSCTPPTELQ